MRIKYIPEILCICIHVGFFAGMRSLMYIDTFAPKIGITYFEGEKVLFVLDFFIRC